MSFGRVSFLFCLVLSRLVLFCLSGLALGLSGLGSSLVLPRLVFFFFVVVVVVAFYDE